ncbi:FtsX-like permease family protein [Acinetobacter qingfengensis]|uniref:ABC transporter permease n=1 Tax=Acinetobacter qingfengensis TaxID=1262585 RepID=A0A1E7R758_9GAMM|nr:FtsX-like permease family protein [Acinetobacter qingfengensis]KAA8734571.1 FtsX-like permease family protein [Acinetobacter qingfengensis]OEY95142.1 ABC transporter permease [Acinetobacter qingfengensis]
MLRLFSSLFRQSLFSGGIALLILALSLAISATTALKFANQQIGYAIEQQAAELLAADLVISDNQPIDALWQQHAQAAGLKISNNLVFGSMAHNDENFVMVNVKAIDDTFPLRGQLHISPQQKSVQQGQIWLSPRVFDLLKVKIGDRIAIADAEFLISGKIDLDTNQELGFSGFSPTVVIHRQDVARTNAIQVGSRIDYRLLMSGEPEQIKAFVTQYQSQIKPPLRLRQANDDDSRLMRPIDNLSTYMQLANLLTLLLCGIAIALTCQRYVSQNQDHIAMLRCLGASRVQILGAFTALLAIIAAIATLLGGILGVACGYGLLQIMLLTMPQIELHFSIWSVILGPLPNAILTCLIVLAGFVLPSIFHLAKVPPVRVLRQGQLDQVSVIIVMVSAIASLAVFTLYLTENILFSLSVMAGIVVLCLLLFVIAWSTLKILKQRFLHLEQWIRQPAKMSLQMTALALGLSLICVLFLLRTDLLERWQQQLPENTPNQFVYGLPPTDKVAFEQALLQQNWTATPLYPNVRGRLVAKNQQAFSQQLRDQNNSLKRELNLTQSNIFPKDNLIVAGQTHFQQANQVSVEQKTAQELGIQLGDTLTFDLPDGAVTAKVVSFRAVEWESFSPNFFFIFSPNTLDENAGSYLGSFYVPDTQHRQMTQMIQQFPTTVFIDVNAILDQVKRLVGVITQIVTFLAALVFTAGVLVLLACLNLIMDERRQEVALLRAIGMSQRQLKRYLTLEMAFTGFGAGILSIAFAEIVSWIVAQRLDLIWGIHWQYWLILPLGMAVLCGLIGRYRLRKLWQIAPLLSLRQLN